MSRVTDGFDAVEFVSYAHARWRNVLIACAVAVVLAGGVSLLLPKRYTATASLMIEPPAGLDPRGATAVSPVYLESLRTYEHLATSDTLFLQALDHLHIRQRYAGRSVESLKRAVLQVSKPVSTRVVDISATLPDANEAQQLAQYIAEQVVVLNTAIGERSATDVIKGTEASFGTAQTRLGTARKAIEEFSAQNSEGSLQTELDSDGELRFELNRDLERARTELAGSLPGKADADIASARARMADLESQAGALEQRIAAKGTLLERLKQKHEALDAEFSAARGEFESTRAKLEELKTSAAFRGERLDILDPGIVPQRPSSPNVMLNVLVALLVSLMGSVGWMAFRFGYERMRRERPAPVYSLR